MSKIKLKRKIPSGTIKTETIEDVPLFENMVHISDIHIRPLRRHDEFQAVFEQTVRQIANIPRSVIVITGDLFDNKTTFHPETFKLARDFLKALTGITHVFLIAGNHDMYENNQNRLDAITPIAEDIPGLHYLKYSGVYYVAGSNYCFVVSSLYDKQFIRKGDFELRDNYKYIALYHGAISGTTTDAGYEVPSDPSGLEDAQEASTGTTRYRSLADFTGFDAVLLGDIHKHQIRKVPDGGLMAYAGSLVQQNHGEPLSGHGLLIWDRDLKCRFEAVPNPYGFLDIHCENSIWTNADVHYIPAKCYARLIIRNCTEEQLNVITALVKLRCETLFIEKRQCLSNSIKEAEIPPTVQRVGDENELITELAADATPEELLAILALHAQYQQELDQSAVQMNTVVWKPVSLEFKNLFGYGGDTVNRVEFSPGVTCISAANARGKTSFVNILLFGIFGKTLLNPSGSNYTFDIVNTGCDAGYVKIHLNYGNVFYLIERKSVKKKTKAAGVSLNRLNSYEFTCGFWRSNAEGEAVENLQDTRKKNTDTALTELFGDITDFSLSNLLNADSLDLLAMTPTEQIKTLKRLFRLEIYDQYREVNRAHQTTLETEIARLTCERQHFEATLACQGEELNLEELTTEHAECAELVQAMRDNLTLLQEEAATITGQIDAINPRIQVLDSDLVLPVLSDKELKKEIQRLRKSVSSGVSCKELDYRRATLEAALRKTAKKTPLDGRSALEQEQAGLDLKGEEASVYPGGMPSVQLSIARIKDKLELLRQSDPDPFPEKTIANLQTDIARLKADQVPLSSSFAAIEEKLARFGFGLEFELDPETDVQEDDEEGLKRWTKENAAQQTSLRVKISALESTMRDLQKRRSGRPVKRTREELHAELVDLPYSTVRDVRPMDAIDRKIKSLTAKLNQGERGRLTDLMTTLRGQINLTQVDRQRILAYLEEKYSGVYDPTIGASLTEIKTLEKEYQNYVLIGETNAQILLNAAVQADLAELDYHRIALELGECRVAYDRIVLDQTVLDLKKSDLKQKLQVQELTREREAHLISQVLEERIQILARAIDAKTAVALQKELNQLETTRQHLRYAEIEEQLTEIARVEQLRQEIDHLKVQYAQEALYEMYVLLLNEVHRRERATLVETLTIVQTDTAGQQAALVENETRLMELGSTLKLAEYKRGEIVATQEKCRATSALIIHAQKALLPYERYARIMSNRGIACRLLYLKIKAIEGYINRIIQSFTKYTVHILYDDAKQSISIITENRLTNEHLSIQRLSGYEKLMLQVAFKRALNKFSYNSKSSILIMDEALDCIDGENFQTKLPEVIAMIAQDYAIAIAISQRDISHISDRSIAIRLVNGYSRVLSS
jgi:DNA repair exonuclease SbcCD nuclease subunit